mgnify:CR=1 FL=1
MSEVELDDDADHGEHGDNIAHSAGTAMLLNAKAKAPSWLQQWREIEDMVVEGEPLEAIEWKTIKPRALIT